MSSPYFRQKIRPPVVLLESIVYYCFHQLPPHPLPPHFCAIQNRNLHRPSSYQARAIAEAHMFSIMMFVGASANYPILDS
jgi:hypothetical protein